MRPPSLTDDDIHRIRTEGRPDTYWALKLNVSQPIVQKARVGKTYKNHPTPPDRRPRASGTASGNQYTKETVQFPPSPVSQALANWKRVEVA
jgi:hypothetical protein